MSSDAAKNAYPDAEDELDQWLVEFQREAYDRGAREKAAEAWDEGAKFGYFDYADVPADADYRDWNPYREAEQ